MLTLPKIVKRGAKPYVAIRQKVAIPFGKAVDKTMPKVAGWLAAQGIADTGPAIFRYNVVVMPELDMEFGFIPGKKLAGDEMVTAGILPAGSYATLTYLGHYRNLMEVNAVLIGWARQRGIAWDATESKAGDSFAGRFEIYPNGPADEPDSSKWETQLFIKIRE